MKIDILADAATKLIEAIKRNYAEAHNKTEIEALNRLSQVFVDATKILSGLEIKTQSVEQAPRAEGNATASRVEKTTQAILTGPTEPPPRMPKATNNLPNLIPANDSDYESNDHESHNDNKYVENYDPTPAYNTCAHATKKKTFHSNVMQDTILTAVEMSFEQMSPERLAQQKFT